MNILKESKWEAIDLYWKNYLESINKSVVIANRKWFLHNEVMELMPPDFQIQQLLNTNTQNWIFAEMLSIGVADTDSPVISVI